MNNIPAPPPEYKQYVDRNYKTPVRGWSSPVRSRSPSFSPVHIPARSARSPFPACYQGGKSYRKYLGKGQRSPKSQRTGKNRSPFRGPRGGRYNNMPCRQGKEYGQPSTAFRAAMLKRSLDRQRSK